MREEWKSFKEGNWTNEINVSDFIKQNGIENNNKNAGVHNFYVSDKPDSFKAQASVLLGEELDDRRVEQVDLSTL